MSVYTTNNKLKQVLGTVKGSAISTGGVTFIMIALMVFFAILPAYRSITDQMKNNEAKESYLNQLKTKKTTLDKLAVAYEKNIVKIDYFNLYNNSTLNTEVFLANIDSIAAKNKAKLMSLSIQGNSDYQPSENSPFKEFSSFTPQQLALSFRLKLGDISMLIDQLESYPQTIYIQDITIAQIKATEDTFSEQETLSLNDYVNVDLSGEIYFWNKPAL